MTTFGADPNFQKKLAAMLLQQGTDTSPVQHWTQGAARMAQALVGGNMMRAEREADQQNAEKIGQFLMAGQGGAPAAAAPSITPGPVPMPATSPPASSRVYSENEFNPLDVAVATPKELAAGAPAQAISGIESGGRYDAIGPQTKYGRAYGKYQVLDSNIGPWTREFAGREMTPQEFLADPQAQDRVFQGQFGKYTQRYGSPEAASRAWFAGPGNMNNMNAKDVLGKSVADYSRKFVAGGGDPAALPPNAQPAQGQGMPTLAPETPSNMPVMQPQAPTAPMPNPGAVSPRAIGNALLNPQGGAGNPNRLAIAAQLLADPRTPPHMRALIAQQMTPRETFRQETDADGNIWSINNLNGQRTVALKRERPPEKFTQQTDPDGTIWNVSSNGQKTVAKKPEADPTSIREYAYYRNTFKPTAQSSEPMDYATWSTQKARAGATTVTNNLGGGSDKQIFDSLDERTKEARATANGLVALRNARLAITGDGGNVTGFKANERLALQKAASWLGIGDTKAIQNTETFRSAIAPQVAAVMKATVGSAQISNSDREFAEKAAGGAITLDEGSIKRLLDIMERASIARLQDHQEQLDAIYPDPVQHKRERALFGVKVPTVAAPPSGKSSSGVKWEVE